MPTSDQETAGRESERGFALVMVLGFLLLLAAFLAPFASSARTRMLTTQNMFEETQARLALEAIQQDVATRYADTLRSGRRGAKFNLDEPSTCTAGAVSVAVKIQEHSGLIDLNAASADLLALGLQSLGLPDFSAQELARKVELYRSMDASARAGSDSGDDIANGYKHAAFEDVRELYDFEALNAFAPAMLMRTFTVYSRSGTISAATMSRNLESMMSAKSSEAEQFLISETRTSNVVTIETWIKSPGFVPKYSASVFRLFGEDDRIQHLATIASLATDVTAAFESGDSCSGAFGNDVAAFLERTFG